MDSFDFILVHEVDEKGLRMARIFRTSLIRSVKSKRVKKRTDSDTFVYDDGSMIFTDNDYGFICAETPEEIFELLKKAYIFDPKRIYDVRLQEENIMDFMRRMKEGDRK